MDEAFRIAAQCFVVPAFRERFIHECVKRPERLATRVCHDIESLFEPRFKHGACQYAATDECLVLTSRLFARSTWRDVARRLHLGEGILVIAADGRAFHAESEGSPSSIVYAGNC